MFRAGGVLKWCVCSEVRMLENLLEERETVLKSRGGCREELSLAEEGGASVVSRTESVGRERRVGGCWGLGVEVRFSVGINFECKRSM